MILFLLSCGEVQNSTKVVNKPTINANKKVSGRISNPNTSTRPLQGNENVRAPSSNNASRASAVETAETALDLAAKGRLSESEEKAAQQADGIGNILDSIWPHINEELYQILEPKSLSKEDQNYFLNEVKWDINDQGEIDWEYLMGDREYTLYGMLLQTENEELIAQVNGLYLKQGIDLSKKKIDKFGNLSEIKEEKRETRF